MKGLRMPKPTLTKNKDKPNLFFISECDHQIFFHSQITKRKIKLDFSNKRTINMPTDFVNKNINRYSINTCNKYGFLIWKQKKKHSFFDHEVLLHDNLVNFDS